ncbi:MAG TPA: AraC family transcriptional regulator [Chitinophagaceae bacterium]
MQNHFRITQSPLLKDTVYAFFGTHRPNDPPVHETIIPKGAVEIIFSFETPKILATINNQTQALPRCFVTGIHTIPIQLYLKGVQDYFGVVLYAAAAKRLLKFQPVEFSNCFIDLTLVDDSFDSLWHCLAEQKSFDEKTTVFTNWLSSRLPGLTSREQAFNSFLQDHTNSPLSVSQLAKQFCYSSKQLSRKMYELTGMNTEQVLLYKKYLQALHLMHSPQLSLTEIAYSCHFSDQSHFIKTFKTFTQLTPNEYRRRKGFVPGHIFENVS